MGFSPYEHGRQVGMSFGAARQEASDQGNIKNILAEAQASGDPQVLQNSIGRILSSVSKENQPAAINYLQNMMASAQAKQEQAKKNIAYEKRGLDPYLPESISKLDVENKINTQRANNILGIGNTQNQPGQEPINQPGNQQINTGINYSTLSDEQLVQLRQIPGYDKSSDAELKRRQEAAKIDQKQRSDVFQSDLERSQKVLLEADKIASTIPQKQASLDSINDAIANQDMSFWSWDNFADKTGIEAFRTPEGAAFKTALKEYFLGNISRAGARPNQWIEQQIQDMLPKIGTSQAARLFVTRLLQNELDLDKKRVDVSNDISERLRSEGNYSQGNLSRLVQKEMLKYVDETQKNMYNDLRAIKSIEQKKPYDFVKVQPGTPVSKYMVQSLLLLNNNDPELAAKQAKKLGYKIE